jgi:hypothetical protein
MLNIAAELLVVAPWLRGIDGFLYVAAFRSVESFALLPLHQAFASKASAFAPAMKTMKQHPAAVAAAAAAAPSAAAAAAAATTGELPGILGSLRSRPL